MSSSSASTPEGPRTVRVGSRTVYVVLSGFTCDEEKWSMLAQKDPRAAPPNRVDFLHYVQKLPLFIGHKNAEGENVACAEGEVALTKENTLLFDSPWMDGIAMKIDWSEKTKTFVLTRLSTRTLVWVESGQLNPRKGTTVRKSINFAASGFRAQFMLPRDDALDLEEEELELELWQ